jgi:single-stranded-DNA-specific exonuclease
MEKKWILARPDGNHVDRICKGLGCSRVLASVLVNRGLSGAGAASAFLDASLADLRPPFEMKGMQAAVERICAALTARERILVFGDYDVDGVTATAMLMDFFQQAGADVVFYVPHRLREGYGLKVEHIADVVLPAKARLMITVDCGSSSHDAVSAARSAGIGVIITDHHLIDGPLPDACAVVNPKRPDCRAGFDELSGVGVAFCLLICLRKRLREAGFWRRRREPNLRSACDLVALGTVADMVPLVAQNRILAKAGLEVINTAKRPGIAALVDVAAIRKETIDAEDVAFRLGPRLNAAGRIDHAETAVRLLGCRDLSVARRLGERLEQWNRMRRNTERQILYEAHRQLTRHPDLDQRRTIVLAREGWHAGILGIVASRIAKSFFRPTILLAVRDGSAQGSARSIPGVNLHRGLERCADCLTRFGGHALAAGLALAEKDVDRLRECFEEAIAELSTIEDFVPRLAIDYELDFRNIDDHLVDELERLKPFGAGNPEPLFMARQVRVATSCIVGQNHRRMTLTQPHDPSQQAIDAIQFNVDQNSGQRSRFDRMAYRVRWNRWRGSKTLQAVIEEV